MTPANARHHLAILEDQGRVEVVGQRQVKGRGRPAQLFKLSEQALGDNLDGLARALLDVLFAHLPSEERSKYMRQIASRMVEVPELEDGTKPAGHLTQRLYQAVQSLNELKYQARWEARSDAPHLILGHCPYAAILPDHPEMCQLDALLMEELLQTTVKQTARLAQDTNGATYCVFAVGKSNPHQSG